jgi:predicted kinase
MDKRVGKLIIVCGLPGSGKTTTAIRLQQEYSAIRLSADDWMTSLSVNLHDEGFRAKIEALQWRLGKELLGFGLTVIIEWGAWARTERDRFRTEARSLGALVWLYYLSAPIDVLFDRIQRRGAEDPPIRREEVSEWAKVFQAPTTEEMALYDQVTTDTVE